VLGTTEGAKEGISLGLGDNEGPVEGVLLGSSDGSAAGQYSGLADPISVCPKIIIPTE